MKKLLFVLLAITVFGFLGTNAYAYETETYNEVPNVSLLALSEQDFEVEIPSVFQNERPPMLSSMNTNRIQPRDNQWLSIWLMPSSNPGGFLGTSVASRVESFWSGTFHSASAWLRETMTHDMIESTYRTTRTTHHILVISGSNSSIVQAAGSQRR